MVNSFRKSFDTEEGQAIIIGALMMLILAFGLMVTLNIGTAVQEKIRLQNNSDAAAYSLAVTEAQAFNYVAFTNRVQAAHYNMIMTIQTYQVTLLIIESVLGTLYDLFASIYGILFWFPYVGEILYYIAMGFGGVMTIIKLLYYGNTHGKPSSLGFIPFMGYTKQAIWYINYAHYIADLIVTGAVLLKTINNMGGFINQNDSRVKTNVGIYKIVNAALNTWEYLSTFDKYAGGLRALFSSERIKKKKRNANQNNNRESTSPYNRPNHAKYRQKIMGEIANASRSSKFNLDRYKIHKENLFIVKFTFEKIGASKMLGISPRILQNANKNGPYYNLGSLKGGHGNFKDGMIYPIRKKGITAEGRSIGPWGDIIASDKGFQLTLEIGFGNIAGIINLGMKQHIGFGTYMWSDNNGGNYWRWATPADNNTGICWNFGSNRNDACMNNQRSNLYEPTQAYIRIPFRIWDFLPGSLQSLISTIRHGIPPIGCNFSEGVNVRDWNKNTFGPDDKGAWPGCHNRGPCSWWRPWGCCTFIPAIACYVEWIAHKRIPNHEVVHHKKNAQQYYFGVAPYVKFNPKDDRRMDYNQPSTWMLMNLAPGKFLTGNPWNFSQTKDILGTSNASSSSDRGGTWSEHKKNEAVNRDFNGQTGLSTNPVMDKSNTKYSNFKMFSVLAPGINVMSRARVYYHRPGNWNEQPNFFNPYWRAQLAPIAPKIGALVGRVLNVDSTTNNAASDKGGGGLFGGGFGNIKTMLGDFFVNVLSSVITH